MENKKMPSEYLEEFYKSLDVLTAKEFADKYKEISLAKIYILAAAKKSGKFNHWFMGCIRKRHSRIWIDERAYIELRETVKYLEEKLKKVKKHDNG